MFLTPENAICKQRLAQKLLSSPKMLPPTLKPYLRRLQDEANVDFSRFIEISDHVLTYMAGESHQKIKKALAKSLGLENLLSYEGKVAQAADFLVASLQSEPGPISITKSIEDPLYLFVVKEIFGYKPKSDEVFLQWIGVAARIAEPMQSVKTLLQVQGIFDQLITEISEQICAADSSGLIKDISRELASEKVDCNSTQQSATIIATLIVATRTTSETLSSILLENSRLAPLARKRFANEHWVKDHIDELIRFCASTTYLTRTAAEDLNVDELQIPKDSDVLIHIPSSNRDSSYYDNCDYAKIAGSRTKRHISFGAGVHRCPGEQLAILTLTHVIPTLYQHFPELRVDTSELRYKSIKMANRMLSASVSLY